jgi:hypothetical protein
VISQSFGALVFWSPGPMSGKKVEVNADDRAIKFGGFGLAAWHRCY